MRKPAREAYTEHVMLTTSAPGKTNATTLAAVMCILAGLARALQAKDLILGGGLIAIGVILAILPIIKRKKIVD